jgi:hypothetical protein
MSQVQALYRLIDAGRVRPVKVGHGRAGKVLIPASEGLRLLQSSPTDDELATLASTGRH